METSATFYRVHAFISAYTCIHSSKINHNTGIEQDLRISGDNGIEFLYAFFYAFGVDYTGINVDKYISPEGFDPIGLPFI